MERVIANSVVTRAFCISTPVIRSRVHFSPSAGSTAVHHPVWCELTLFGKGIERRSVRIEGGRLNQPDGIRLEDAFPALENEASGMCGLEVAFECSQGRVNLCHSKLVVEIVSPQFSLTYGAAQFRPREQSEPSAVTNDQSDQRISAEPRIGIALQDSRTVSSLVVVNPSAELLRPEFKLVVQDQELPLQLGTVAPESAVEFPLEEALCRNALMHEPLWGSAVVTKLWEDAVRRNTCSACYILYRDPVSKRPTSVCAL